MDVHRDPRWRGYRLPAYLLALYAPYAWLLVVGDPWRDSYQRFWLRLWPILPGLPVAAIPVVHRQPDEFEFLVMSVITAGIVALLTFLARRRAHVAVVPIVALLSAANSWVAYQLFRA